ncbi:MAG: RHS repeat domain-containing protein, partial [Acidobacteriota bacterium]
MAVLGDPDVHGVLPGRQRSAIGRMVLRRYQCKQNIYRMMRDECDSFWLLQAGAPVLENNIGDVELDAAAAEARSTWERHDAVTLHGLAPADDDTWTMDTYPSVGSGATAFVVVTSPMGRAGTVWFDQKGRPEHYQFADLAPVRLERDDRGRLVAVRAGEGNDERVTQFGYNDDAGVASGFLEQARNALLQTVHLGYDADGWLDAADLPDGRRTEFDFDAAGNLTDLVAP